MIVENKEQLLQIMRKRGTGDHYEWHSRPGFNFAKKADPEVVGRHLEAIAEANGGIITTDMLAADSDRQSSPLHPLVTHDMEIAAFNWRRHEVRQIVGSLVMVKIMESEEQNEAQEIRVRGFMHANAEGENVYAPVHIVARVPDLRDQIEQRLKLEIRSWQARAREFSLFGEVVAAIDALDQPDPTPP